MERERNRPGDEKRRDGALAKALGVLSGKTSLMNAPFIIYCEKNTDSVSKDEKNAVYSRNFSAGTSDGRADIRHG